MQKIAVNEGASYIKESLATNILLLQTDRKTQETMGRLREREREREREGGCRYFSGMFTVHFHKIKNNNIQHSLLTLVVLRNLQLM
jgi:hypothetical protein